MKRKKRIVALAGLSGSGKSTLLHALGGQLAFTHLSASTLLKERAARTGEPQDAETLRLGNIDANQQMLIEAFNEAASGVVGDIIFDCHTVIDTPTGLQFIPSVVFDAIGITDMAFLSVDPHDLVKRREQDTDRSRPSRTVDELEKHQVIAVIAAQQIAETIGATFTDIGLAPEDAIISLLTANDWGMEVTDEMRRMHGSDPGK